VPRIDRRAAAPLSRHQDNAYHQAEHNDQSREQRNQSVFAQPSDGVAELWYPIEIDADNLAHRHDRFFAIRAGTAARHQVRAVARGVGLNEPPRDHRRTRRGPIADNLTRLNRSRLIGPSNDDQVATVENRRHRINMYGQCPTAPGQGHRTNCDR
jgi:hypothetical protein